MSSAQIKYNPGIRGDAELVRSFVVRKVELDLALETLRENADSKAPSNQHILFVGPRGIGKTMLVRRVAAEVRAVPALAAAWYPIVFAEDAYLVSSPGEFWLEALFHLGEQTGDERWAQAYEGLKAEADEVRLRERALAHLLDFADRENKRILLIVENLNRLLGEQIQGHSHWDLRHTLQNERRIMLLGTATTRFEEIENIDKAWFEMFAIHDLKPLDHKDCMELWRAVTASEAHAQRVRAVQILTGGNPRLLTILAEFAAKRSFRELMDQLIQLVDDHTEYFKSHLDNLPPSERKAFVTLLDRWDAAGARQVARSARMGVNNVSVQLNRLVGRGAVEIVQQDGRRKLYQAAERLYNIYYLMRRRAHPSARVQAVVDFMVHFYEGEELVEMTADLAREACLLSLGERGLHYLAYAGILSQVRGLDVKRKIIGATPGPFFEGIDVPVELSGLLGLPQHGIPAVARNSVHVEAYNGLHLEDEVLVQERAPSLEEQGRFSEAEQVYRDALVRDPQDVVAWSSLGQLLHWHLERYAEAEQAYRRAIELAPNVAWGWSLLAILLHEKLGRYEEAEQAYRKAIELWPHFPWTWGGLGRLLHVKLRRDEEAEQALRKAVELLPSWPWAWFDLGALYADLRRDAEAEQAFVKGLELERPNSRYWPVLIKLRLSRGDDSHAVLQQACEFLDRGQRDGAILDLIARLFCEDGPASCLPQAELWAREAVEKDRDWKHVRTLVSILGAQGKWEQALEEAGPLLSAPATDTEAGPPATQFIIDAAAAGHAQQALQALTASAGAAALEPLSVGLRVFLGEKPLVAHEIFEIGQDVAQRIRERQAAPSK